MTNVTKLVEEMYEATDFRGHNMKQQEKIGHYVTVYQCLDCNMRAVINIKPMPNEIHLSGQALALHCDEGA